MAAKPEPSEVAVLVGVEETPTIQLFIDDAALLAERCIVTYSEDRQRAILKWLAAHLMASTPSGATLKSESVDGATYTRVVGAVGGGLESTTFGMQALELDTDGCLREVGQRRATLERL